MSSAATRSISTCPKFRSLAREAFRRLSAETGYGLIAPIRRQRSTLGIVVEHAETSARAEIDTRRDSCLREADEALDALARGQRRRPAHARYIDGDALDMIPHQVSGDSTVARGALIIEQGDVADEILDAWTSA